MAITVYTELSPRWWIPESEKETETENQARFNIRPLTGKQEAAMVNEIVSVGDDFKLTDRGIVLALDYGLIGWENIIDENQRQIPYSKNARDSKLSGILLRDIAYEIMSISVLKDEHRKNS